jgi:hypothetical protein
MKQLELEKREGLMKLHNGPFSESSTNSIFGSKSRDNMEIATEKIDSIPKIKSSRPGKGLNLKKY